MSDSPTPHQTDYFCLQRLNSGLKAVLVPFSTGIASISAAIAFYTCLPIPLAASLEFRGVARLAPLVGLIIGSLLGLLNTALTLLDAPALTQSAVVVVAWIGLTGGLHLDGAMDTADGLAVQDPQRRLQVMTDSATGAFGAMAAIALVLLKTAALTDLNNSHWLVLMLAAGWGRWGQQVAIARYPYLKPTGKGAFHKTAICSLWDVVPSLLLLLGFGVLPLALHSELWSLTAKMTLGGSAIALLVPAWFNHQLGGHTGDTYGAVVEWTEAFFLVMLVLLQSAGGGA